MHNVQTHTHRDIRRPPKTETHYSSEKCMRRKVGGKTNNQFKTNQTKKNCVKNVLKFERIGLLFPFIFDQNISDAEST